MRKTKIEFAGFSWNPVWGCRLECPYCYARRIAERFGKSFEPHLTKGGLNQAMPAEPSVIFVNSMSEIAFWKNEWFHETIKRIERAPQHVFLFLTKVPHVYSKLDGYAPHNAWFGVTVTMAKDLRFVAASPLPGILENDPQRKAFVNYEPLLEMPADHEVLSRFHWMIVGAETGNRAEKVIPAMSWRTRICEIAEARHLPLFMKGNVQEAWGTPLICETPKGEPWTNLAREEVTTPGR